MNASSYRAAGKADRLLRAAVTSFCATARPTRRDAAQLDDLSVPLIGSVSDETLRFAAAALSETPYAPPALIRRLADLPVEISAPLLMRSPVLTPIDLLALIARHGAPHARAIAGRPGLDRRILLLIRTLDIAGEGVKPASADEARTTLRTMMRPAEDTTPKEAAEPAPIRIRWEGEPGVYRKLRSAALVGAPIVFHTALAGALGIDTAEAAAMVEDVDPARLIVALRALGLGAEEAFLVIQCLRPVRARRDVANFLNAWEAVSREDAARVAAGWREPSPHAEPANETWGPRNLRAS
ncbi:MAG: hypothetical protein M9945_09125 [Aquamicrobium sp.]|uniref:hypothetical protein n=1 Tax=Aquamicrobium sp. TaxID=1872579 RepID=UPI00349EEE43|nr:hypothetical protein [Aquamicrobium sp.]